MHSGVDISHMMGVRGNVGIKEVGYEKCVA